MEEKGQFNYSGASAPDIGTKADDNGLHKPRPMAPASTEAPAADEVRAIHTFPIVLWGVITGALIRNPHGYPNETEVSDSDSQAFLMLCESPCHRRFLPGVRTVLVHTYSSPGMVIRISHGFASQADSRESDTHPHMPICESPYSGVKPPEET